MRILNRYIFLFLLGFGSLVYILYLEQDFYVQTIDLARQGQYQQALDRFDLLTNKYPSNKKYVYDKILVLTWARKYADALTLADSQNVQDMPEETLQALGIAARGIHDYPKAEFFFKLAQNKSPSIDPKLGLGWTLIEENQINSALAYLNQLAREYSNNPNALADILFALATAEQANNNLSQAASLYAKILTINPNYLPAKLNLLNILQQQDMEAAYAFAQENRAALSDQVWADVSWNYAAWLIHNGKQIPAAQPNGDALIDRGITLAQNNLVLLNNLNLSDKAGFLKRGAADLIVALLARKRQDEAFAEYTRLPSDIKLPAYALQDLADAYLSRREAEPAKNLYLEVLQQAPDNYNARLGLIYSYQELKQKAEINAQLDYLQAVAKAQPTSTAAQYQYLHALAACQESKKLLSYAKEVNIADAPAYILEDLGRAARDGKDYAQAHAFYRQAIAKFDSETAKIGDALVSIDQRRGKIAIQALEKLHQLKPDSQEINQALAYGHRIAGAFAKSQHYYSKILESNPRDNEAKQGVYTMMIAKGEKEQALEYVRANPGIAPDPRQYLETRLDVIAHKISLGRETLTENPDDYTHVDASIRELKELIVELKKQNAGAYLTNRAKSDLISALNLRKQYTAAIAQYEELEKQKIKLPIYVRLEAAAAYINGGKPETAKKIYHALQQEAPENLYVLKAIIAAHLRNNDKDQAEKLLPALKELASRRPLDQDYVNGYMEALGELDKDDELLSAYAEFAPSDPPAYILDLVARAERNKGHYLEAEQLYRASLEQNPDRFAPQFGLALIPLDLKQPKIAIGLLKILGGEFPNNLDAKLALAQAYQDDKQFQPAYDTFQDALKLKPNNKEAKRGSVFNLAYMHRFTEAVQLAYQNQNFFSDEERLNIKVDEIDQILIKGEQKIKESASDFSGVDVAISDSEAQLRLLPKLQLKDALPWRRRLSASLLLALRDRERFAEAVQVYEKLQQEHVELPAYAKNAVADSYLNNHQPRKARDLYLSILKEDPNYFNAQMSLIYAYLENEEIEKAKAFAKTTVNMQPETLDIITENGEIKTLPNRRKESAEFLEASISLYTEDYALAQQKFKALDKKYPGHKEIKNKLAEIYYYRGWPRLAKRTQQENLANAPDDHALKLILSRSLFDMHYYNYENLLINDLLNYAPEDSGVKEQYRVWRSFNKKEWVTYFNGSESSNARDTINPVSGSNQIGIESYLYSSPINQYYRLFTHDGWRTGEFVEGRAYWRHYGLGMDARAGRLTAAGEVYFNDYKGQTVGANFNADYQLSDQWRVFGRYSYLDDTISLRALNNGITANTVRAGGVYRWDDTRSFTFSSTYTAFSDNNQRVQLDGNLYQRLINTPRYKLNFYSNTYASANTNDNADYYNPHKDFSQLFSLENDYLTLRSYDVAFNQRFTIAGGAYWQEGYGTNPIGNILYEHRWQIHQDVTISYNAGRYFRFYNGELTESWQGSLMADIHF